MTLTELFTNIANAIRSKKGTSDKINATDFATEIENIQTGGGDVSEYFTETISSGEVSTPGYAKIIKKIPNNLKIAGTSAAYMFYGYLLDEIPFLDTSNIVNMNSMFSRTRLETIPQINTSKVTNFQNMFDNDINLREIPYLDTSKGTNFNAMLYYCYNLKTIPQMNMQNATNLNSMFSQCRGLTDIPQLDLSKTIQISSMFYNCAALKNIGGFLNLGKAYVNKNNNSSAYTLNLSYSKIITYESLMNVINNLYDLNLTYDVANGGTLYTQSLQLGSTNLAKLTAEEIAIATNKGWTVS